MGDRGPNAKPVKKPRRWINPVKRVAAPGRKVKQPWDDAGLTRVERVIVFLETLPISSGMLSGTKFKVQDWQRKEILEPIYAIDELGHRIVREAFISIPRKNGKTGLVAGLTACHLCGPESVERGQIVSAAGNIEQSSLVFDELCAMIERTPWMDKRIAVKSFTKELEDVVTGTKYKSISSESKTKFGKSPSLWIYDELGQAPDRKLYVALSTAMGAWLEPLGIVISTQIDDPKHIMSELYDDAEQMVKAGITDPFRHSFIRSAPLEADPWSEETWRACNPALGTFKTLADIQAEASKAKRMPSLQASFRLFMLNQRVSTEERFIDPPVWAALGRDRLAFNLASLQGRECYAALDLSGSGKNDLTALVLLFRTDSGDLKVVPFFWAAEANLEKAEHRDRFNYRLAAERGQLLTTPGTLLDYGFIAQKLGELTVKYQIKVLAIDPWGHERLIKELEDIGVDLMIQKHGMGIKDMTPAVTALENEVISGKLKHPQNEILTWNIDNVKVLLDSSGNRKFDKRKARGRIDGAVALVMACNLAASFEPEEVGSYACTII